MEKFIRLTDNDNGAKLQIRSSSIAAVSLFEDSGPTRISIAGGETFLVNETVEEVVAAMAQAEREE